MAESNEYLIAVIGADVTAFRRGMREVRSEIGMLDAETTQAVSRLGRTLTYTLTTPLLIAGGAVVKMAADFDASMRNINSIAFLSESAFADLSQEVLDFGKNTRQGATQAAESLYSIYSAGVSGQLAFDLMKVATYTAEAGLADMTVTSEGMVAAMLSFGFTTESEAMRVSDAITRMVQIGVGSMQQFVGSIATFMPSAAALGVEIEEAFAINARLTQMGYSASEAAVRTNAAMRSMIKPTEAMQQAFRKLGVRGTKELIEQQGGLLESLIALRGTTDGTEESLAKLFSDTRALQGVLLLTGNIDASRQALKDFNAEVNGATMRAWEEQAKSFAYQWDRLKSAFQAAGITVGQQLLPALAPLVGMVKDFFIGITNLEGSTIRWNLAIAGTVAALGPLLWLIGSLASPFGALVLAIVGIKNAFDTNFQGIADIVRDFRYEIEAALNPITTFLNDFWATLNPPKTFVDWTPEITMGDPVITHQVQAGDTYWDLWKQYFPNGELTWDEFKNLSGVDTSVKLTIGDFLTFGNGTGTATGGNPWLSAAEGIVNHIIENATDTGGTPVQKLFAMFGDENARMVFSQNLEKAITEAVPRVLHVLDEQGGKLFNALATGFSAQGSTGTGESPFYKAIRDGINGVASLLTGGFAETFPELSAGFGTLLTNMGEWLKTEAVPTISRAFGYIIGRVGVLAGQFANSMIGGLMGGSGEGMANTVNESLVQPFSQGFQDAMSDAGVSGDQWATNLLTGIAGIIGTAAVVNYGIFGIAAAGIQTALKIAMAVLTWPLNIFTGFFSGMASGMATAAPGALAGASFSTKLGSALTTFLKLNPIAMGIMLGTAAYMIIPDSWKQSIRTGVLEGIAGAVGFSEEDRAMAVANFDAAISKFLTDVAADLGTYTFDQKVKIKMMNEGFDFGGWEIPGMNKDASFDSAADTTAAERMGDALFKAMGGSMDVSLLQLFEGMGGAATWEIPIELAPIYEADFAAFSGLLLQYMAAYHPERVGEAIDWVMNLPVTIVPQYGFPAEPTEDSMPGTWQGPGADMMANVETPFSVLMARVKEDVNSENTRTQLDEMGITLGTLAEASVKAGIQAILPAPIASLVTANVVTPFADAFKAGFGEDSTTLEPITNVPKTVKKAIGDTGVEIGIWQADLPGQLTGVYNAMFAPMQNLISLWNDYHAAVKGQESFGGGTPSGTPPPTPGGDGTGGSGGGGGGGGPLTEGGTSYSPSAYLEDSASLETESAQVVVNVNGVQNVDRILADLKRRGYKVTHG